jgi:arginyl-tRNA synthetase
MSNLIEAARNEADALIFSALKAAEAKGRFPAGSILSGAVEIPKDPKNGDWAASHAMAGARSLKKPPREIAETLLENLSLDGTYFKTAEIAGSGFINFRLSDKWYADTLSAIEAEGEGFCRAAVKNGEKIMVEFVSANPTGPMTIGNARGGVLGDSLSNILELAGNDVHREFYINDAGNLVELFGQSIEARYIQRINGEDSAVFPENGYHGDDIRGLASDIYERDGGIYLGMDESTRRAEFIKFGLERNTALMREHLARYRVRFDRWFAESELHDSGYVEETVELLAQNGHTYEKEGALWLNNIALGADKDEVLRRANGFYTYYAVDIAYHREKFVKRGFDRVIDVWGADHHGHAKRFAVTMSAPELGLDGRKLDFLIMQMVRLTAGGETVKVSKRTGKALTLNGLIDEIGVDSCRFFFNAKPDTHLEFDLELAVRQDSENPVYYVQYAHARICSLIANLAQEGYSRIPASEADVSLLETEQERELMRHLAMLPEEVRLAARDLDPSRINRYAVELAARFHRFYNACRLKGEEKSLLLARLTLCDSVRSVLGAALKIIGVSAPEKM